ncbi:hypothetical protein R6Q57_017093 [Mikania cordata]
MADFGFLPNFSAPIKSANFLYSLGMLLDFASFLWLRLKFPTLKRPYTVSGNAVLLVVMCLIPAAFLVVIIVIATKIVFLVSGVLTMVGVFWYFLMKLCKSKKWFRFKNGEEVEVEEEQWRIQEFISVGSLC